MFIILDSSQKDILELTLFDVDTIIKKEYSGKNRELLTFVDAFLHECNVNTKDVQGIAVVVGEGSFTSTRIAVTVANTYGYVLGIPLLAISKKEAEDPQALVSSITAQLVGQYISATYSGEPNIGKKTD